LVILAFVSVFAIQTRYGYGIEFWSVILFFVIAIILDQGYRSIIELVE